MTIEKKPYLEPSVTVVLVSFRSIVCASIGADDIDNDNYYNNAFGDED